MIRRWFAREEGSSATEFALVLPAFLLVTFGIIQLSLLMFAATDLHATTEAAARCWALASTNCTTKLETEARAAAMYRGATGDPTFTATDLTAAGCGWKVHGAADFHIAAGLVSYTVPIAADACFPKLDS